MRPRRNPLLRPHRHVGRRRSGGGVGEVPLGAGCLREPHRGHDEAQSRARDAGHDDPARAGAGRLRLLRRPPRFRAEHAEYLGGDLVDDFALAGTPDKVRDRARSSRSSASTRSRAPTSTAPSTRWRWSGRRSSRARESARLSLPHRPRAGRRAPRSAGPPPVLHPMFIVSRKPAYVARAPWRKTRETAPERASDRPAPPRTQRRAHTERRAEEFMKRSASTSAARSPT